MPGDAEKHVPAEIREILEQHRREVAALRDQGIKRGDELRREAEQKAIALQQQNERQMQGLRDEGTRAAALALEDAKQELKLRRDELIERLAEARKDCLRRGSRDDADAIGRLVAQLETEPVGDVQPAPSNLEGYRSRIGESFLFSVTASSAGPLWGTDIYTTDSSPAKAAIHAGLLRAGESGIIRVTIVERQPNYKGSTRNGVTSSAWHDPWHGAYRVTAAI
jgi:hypothetical protein